MNPKRILVIDDKPEVCELLKDILEREGHRVETADALPQAVASLLAHRYDLVTVDLKMPDMDGADVASLVRALDERMPVVVISGYLTPNRKAQFMEMGIRYFLAKPFRSQYLLGTVETALQEAGHSTA